MVERTRDAIETVDEKKRPRPRVAPVHVVDAQTVDRDELVLSACGASARHVRRRGLLRLSSRPTRRDRGQHRQPDSYAKGAFHRPQSLQC